MEMACVFANLGIKNGTERTYAYGAAVATQAEPYDRDAILQDLRKLKNYVRTLTSDSKIRGPLEYPQDPLKLKEEFPELYEQAFSESPPVSSKWSVDKCAIILGDIPCRNTRTGVTLAPAAAGRSGPCMQRLPSTVSLACSHGPQSSRADMQYRYLDTVCFS